MPTLPSTKEAVPINTPEGLRDFLSYVEDVHSDLVEAQSMRVINSEAPVTELAKGLRAYSVSKEVVDRCLAKRSVSNLEVEQLQTLYNEMLAAYDSIVDARKEQTEPNQRFIGRLAVVDPSLEFKSVKIKVKQNEEKKSTTSPGKAIHSQLHPQILPRKIELRPESRLSKPVKRVIDRFEADEMIVQWFGSVLAFEKFLEEEIMKVEKPSKLHSFLKVKHASAFFDLLIDMTVTDVEQFDSQPRERIKAQLDDSNIEYETYVTWLRHLDRMKRTVSDSEQLTFGELYIVAELLLIEETLSQAK